MNLFYKPNCLTRFYKVPKYEVYVYKNDVWPLSVPFDILENETREEIFEEITGEPLYLENEEGDIVYKEEIPISIGVCAEDIKKIKDRDNLYSYNPLKEVPNLYTELAKIEYFDIPSLNKFVENFGLPLGTDDLFPTDTYSVFIYGLDLFLFYEQLFEYKKAVNIFEALQSKYQEKLQEYAKDYKEYVEEEFIWKISEDIDIQNEAKTLYEGIENRKDFNHRYDAFMDKKVSEFKQTPYALKRLRDIEELSTESKVNHYLVELLNKQPKGEAIYTIIDGQIQPGTTFNSLLEVAYFQLSRAVIGNIEMRHCENCGALFEVLHGAQRFCPPLPERKTSTCQNSFSQRQKRNRKKLLEGNE